LKENFKTV